MGRRKKNKEAKEEKKIIVRTLGAASETRRRYDTNGREAVVKFNRIELSTVDLKRDRVYKNRRLPAALTQVGEVGRGFMVASPKSKCVYIFGGLFNGDDATRKFGSKDSDVRNPGDFYHLGGSRVDLQHVMETETNGDGDGDGDTDSTIVWARLPAPTTDSFIPLLTCLKGDVYAFGYHASAPPALLVDDDDDDDDVKPYWKLLEPLPSHLGECEVHRPLLADHPNDRILMHLSAGLPPSPALYAFHPNTREWKCVAPDFCPEWGKKRLIAALLNGVIYFQRPNLRNLISAYDLTSHQWLDVRWTRHVVDDIHISELEPFDFPAFFSLSDSGRILCLASWGHLLHRPVPESSLFFLKFRVERHADSAAVNLVPLSARSFALTSKHVIDMLPI